MTTGTTRRCKRGNNISKWSSSDGFVIVLLVGWSGDSERGETRELRLVSQNKIFALLATTPYHHALLEAWRNP